MWASEKLRPPIQRSNRSRSLTPLNSAERGSEVDVEAAELGVAGRSPAPRPASAPRGCRRRDRPPPGRLRWCRPRRRSPSPPAAGPAAPRCGPRTWTRRWTGPGPRPGPTPNGRNAAAKPASRRRAAPGGGVRSARPSPGWALKRPGARPVRPRPGPSPVDLGRQDDQQVVEVLHLLGPVPGQDLGADALGARGRLTSGGRPAGVRRPGGRGPDPAAPSRPPGRRASSAVPRPRPREPGERGRGDPAVGGHQAPAELPGEVEGDGGVAVEEVVEIGRRTARAARCRTRPGGWPNGARRGAGRARPRSFRGRGRRAVPVPRAGSARSPGPRRPGRSGPGTSSPTAPPCGTRCRPG